MLLLLPHLQTREVGVAQDQFVPVLEVLRHSALHRLSALLLQGEPRKEERDGLVSSPRPKM